MASVVAMEESDACVRYTFDDGRVFYMPLRTFYMRYGSLAGVPPRHRADMTAHGWQAAEPILSARAYGGIARADGRWIAVGFAIE